MDYTDLTNVKESLDSQIPAADTILPPWITKASRYLDRLCTSQPNVVDYFKLETITNEALTNGKIDGSGRLTLWPHKPVIQSVSALSFRCSLRENWRTADLSLVSVEQEAVVYEGNLFYSDKVYAKVSYTGGLGTVLADLPQDLIDLATVQTVRLYKEARSGLGDAIGIQELGQLVYTKAFASRVLDTLNNGYMRVVPWI